MAKNSIKLVKQLIAEGGVAVEAIDLKVIRLIGRNESYQTVLDSIHKQIDTRFADVFRAELNMLERRRDEGAEWEQLGLFGLDGYRTPTAGPQAPFDDPNNDGGYDADEDDDEDDQEAFEREVDGDWNDDAEAPVGMLEAGQPQMLEAGSTSE